MADDLVIQSSVTPSPAECEALDRLERLLGCSGREVIGSLNELDSGTYLSGDAIRICGWFVDGFASDQFHWPTPARQGNNTAEIEAILGRATERGVRRISIAPMSVVEGIQSYADAINQTSAWLKTAMRVFERFGIDLCVRPGEGGFLTSPTELREFINRINSPALGIDLSTCLPEGLAVWSDWFATLEPYVRSVRMSIDATLDDEHVRAKLADVKKVVVGICGQRSFGGVITVRVASGA